MKRAARKKILLVDDSNTVLMMERMVLQGLGFDILVAHDGKEAVEVARAAKPDVVLMDVVMPRMSGIEACKAIKDAEETKSIPVIMVTTRGEPTNVEAGWEAGCSEYITKPFDATEFLAKVKNFIS